MKNLFLFLGSVATTILATYIAAFIRPYFLLLLAIGAIVMLLRSIIAGKGKEAAK